MLVGGHENVYFALDILSLVDFDPSSCHILSRLNTLQIVVDSLRLDGRTHCPSALDEGFLFDPYADLSECDNPARWRKRGRGEDVIDIRMVVFHDISDEKEFLKKWEEREKGKETLILMRKDFNPADLLELLVVNRE